MSSSETAPLQREEERKSQAFFLANITTIARVFGVITLLVMWISAFLVLDNSRGNFAGFYLVGASMVVTFFEASWILDKFACCVREGYCCRIWSIILWVDNWKKFILYIALSAPLFLEGMRMVLGIVTGFLMVILSTLYLIRTFRSHVAISYEKTEKRVVSSTSASGSGWQVVRHETSTQTDLHDQEVLSTTSTATTSSHSTIP